MDFTFLLRQELITDPESFACVHCFRLVAIHNNINNNDNGNDNDNDNDSGSDSDNDNDNDTDNDN